MGHIVPIPCVSETEKMAIAFLNGLEPHCIGQGTCRLISLDRLTTFFIFISFLLSRFFLSNITYPVEACTGIRYHIFLSRWLWEAIAAWGLTGFVGSLVQIGGWAKGDRHVLTQPSPQKRNRRVPIDVVG